jgi:hypothetical protein
MSARQLETTSPCGQAIRYERLHSTTSMNAGHSGYIRSALCPALRQSGPDRHARRAGPSSISVASSCPSTNDLAAFDKPVGRRLPPKMRGGAATRTAIAHVAIEFAVNGHLVLPSSRASCVVRQNARRSIALCGWRRGHHGGRRRQRLSRFLPSRLWLLCISVHDSVESVYHLKPLATM